MSKILDSHSHYIPPEVAQNTAFFKVRWSDADNHLRMMDEAGIEKSLLLYPTSDAHLNMGGWKNVCRIYNEGIAALVKKHRDRLIGAGILPPDDAKAIKEEIKHLQNLDLRVMSLASSYDGIYLDDEKFRPVFQFAKENKMI